MNLEQMMPKHYPEAVGIHLEGRDVKLDSIMADIQAVMVAKGYNNYGMSRMVHNQRELVYLNEVDTEAAREAHYASCRNSAGGVLTEVGGEATTVESEVVSDQAHAERVARSIGEDKRRLGNELLATLIAKGGWGLPQNTSYITDYLRLDQYSGTVGTIKVHLDGPRGDRFTAYFDGGRLGSATFVFFCARPEGNWYLDSRTCSEEWELTAMEEVTVLHTAILRARCHITHGTE